MDSNNNENAGKIKEVDCGPGCACGSSGINMKSKVIICLIVAIIAIVFLIRGFMRKAEAESAQGQKTFNSPLSVNLKEVPSPAPTEAAVKSAVKSSGPTLATAEKPEPIPAEKAKTAALTTGRPEQTEAKKGNPPATTPAATEKADKTEKSPAGPSLWGNPLESLASLNSVAAGKDAVFIFLPVKDSPRSAEIKKEIEAAAAKIQAGGTTMSAHILKDKSPDYQQVASQAPVPCVLALVKGRGMSAVPGKEITEANLIKALVAASRPSGGCGPSSSGCGPSGCP